MNESIEISEFRQTVSDLLYAQMVLRSDSRPLHVYVLFVPPLEMTFSREACVRRCEAYCTSGISVLKQAFMSTTRGLLA